MNRSFLRALVLIFVCSTASAHAQYDNFQRDFWYPRLEGQRVDYCSADNKACGLAIAHRYCVLMGYARAKHARADPNVGNTRYLGSDEGCHGWRCEGFTKISCLAKINLQPYAPYYYRYKTYVYPRFNHQRVAWCYQDKEGCGKRAAYSFCRRKGYMKASSFIQDKNPFASRALSDGNLCFGSECLGFKSITCYR